MADIETQLQQIADDTDTDLAKLKEAYQEKLQLAKQNAEDDLGEDEVQAFAVGMVRSQLMRDKRTSNYRGEVEEIATLALGHGGTRTWNRHNNKPEKDVLFAYGLINPDPDDPSQIGVAAFIFDETDDMDFGDLRAKFRPLNELKVWATRETGKLTIGDTPIYNCWSTDKTKVVEGDFDDLPSSKDGKRKVLNKYISDVATLADIGDHVSVSNTDDFSSEGDIKRIRGYIVGHYQGRSDKTGKEFGIYNILDDTVVDPNDLPENITGGDDRVDGLTCWTHPDLMEYGNDSQCDFYGTISVTEDGDNKGQIQMNVVGIVPYISMPIDTSRYDGSNDTDDHTDTETF